MWVHLANSTGKHRSRPEAKVILRRFSSRGPPSPRPVGDFQGLELGSSGAPLALGSGNLVGGGGRNGTKTLEYPVSSPFSVGRDYAAVLTAEVLAASSRSLAAGVLSVEYLYL